MTNVTQSRKKQIGIKDIQQKTTEDFWVLNTSSLGGRAQPGQINIPISTERGESINVTIPNTWIPIDLSHQVPKNELLQNPHIRRYVNQGLLTIVDEDWAIETLSEPENQEEADRITQEMNSSISTDVMRGEESAQTMESPNTNQNNPEDGVNTAVIEAVSRDDLSSNERYASIKKNENFLKNADYEYIMKNTDDDKLKNLAKDKLNK